MVFDENYEPKSKHAFLRFQEFMNEIASSLGKSVNENRIVNYYKELNYMNFNEFEKCYKPLKNGEISYNFPSISQIRGVYHDHMREVENRRKSAEELKESEEMRKLSQFGTRWGLRILVCHSSDLIKWSNANAYELCIFASHLSKQIDKGMIDEDEALQTLIEEGKTYKVRIDKVWIKFKTKTALRNREPVLSDYLAV